MLFVWPDKVPRHRRTKVEQDPLKSVSDMNSCSSTAIAVTLGAFNIFPKQSTKVVISRAILKPWVGETRGTVRLVAVCSSIKFSCSTYETNQTYLYSCTLTSTF